MFYYIHLNKLKLQKPVPSFNVFNVLSLIFYYNLSFDVIFNIIINIANKTKLS